MSTDSFEPTIDFSKNPRQVALEILNSGMLFHYLRSVLKLVGLAGEEEAGVAIFFAFASRFRRNPLRVALEEQKTGGMKYAVKAICQLLAPGTFCLAYSEAAWQRFKEHPDHKVVMVSSWSAPSVGPLSATGTFLHARPSPFKVIVSSRMNGTRSEAASCAFPRRLTTLITPEADGCG